MRAQRCAAAAACGAVILVAGAGCASGGRADEAVAPVIDLRADEQLRRMTDYLGGLTQLGFEAAVTFDDYLVDDELVQKTQTVSIDVRRPNRARSTTRGADEDRRYWFDGRTLTTLDAKRNVYATIDAPATFDELLDMLAETYGLVVPLAELVAGNSYRWLMGNVSSATYVGEDAVHGTPCHHLAYRQPTLDWQIWIPVADPPLPQKLVIRYKALVGAPQYATWFTRWDTSPVYTEADFAAGIPPDAQNVAFEPSARVVGRGTRPR